MQYERYELEIATVSKKNILTYPRRKQNEEFEANLKKLYLYSFEIDIPVIKNRSIV